MRFLVFHGDNYYPSGGMKDCRGKFLTLDEAKDCLRNLQISNYYLGGDLTDNEKANHWEGRWGHIYDMIADKRTDGRFLTL